MTMLAQEAKQLLRPPLEQRLLTPIQFLRGIPAWNSHRLLLAFCVYGGADHTLGIEVDPEVVTDRNDLVFEPIGALVRGGVRLRLGLVERLGIAGAQLDRLVQRDRWVLLPGDVLPAAGEPGPARLLRALELG